MANENKTRMLREIAQYYGLQKNADFARFFGLEPATAVMRFKNGFIDFEQVYEKCPDISPEWLLNGGQGPMLRKERDGFIASQNTNIGDNAKQQVVVSEAEGIRTAIEALEKERQSHARTQTALAKAQEQVSDLIAILNNR